MRRRYIVVFVMHETKLVAASLPPLMPGSQLKRRHGAACGILPRPKVGRGHAAAARGEPSRCQQQRPAAPPGGQAQQRSLDAAV